MNPATYWARAFTDELARSGVRHACIAPGSRSTPLVLALAEDERFRKTVHLDERSAGFFALGFGKATGEPALVVTTSGTATANLFPAVAEASMAETPLIVVTADRPPHVRGTDANQTIDQVRLFGTYVRDSVDLPLPRLDETDLLFVRTQACRVVALAKGLPAGPVHVNAPFAKPLEPVPDDGATLRRASQRLRLAVEGREDGRPLVVIPRTRAVPASADLDDLAGLVRSVLDGIVVAGPMPDPIRAGPALTRLASGAGYPILADPLSGARFGEGHGATVLGSYDLFLRVPEIRQVLRPGLVLRVGRAPTSKVVADWLAELGDVPQVVIDPGPRWKDHRFVASTYIRADPVSVAETVAGRVGRPPSGGWRDRWLRYESATREVVGAAHEAGFFEGTVIAEVAQTVPPQHPLVISSSMPVRDLDAFGGTRDEPLKVFGNRGASGVDGVISTALGASWASGTAAVAVIGDVAMIHDLGGLLATREDGVDGVFVVIHNDGGGIFDTLPIREHEPHFTRYFTAPHGLDFRHAAGLFGLRYHRPVDRVGLRHALRAALAMGGSHVLEVRVDRAQSLQRRQDVDEAVAVAVRQRIPEQEQTP
jgi:2-succinyl-5-enolpyruvyl-6-hydroxy-3-cyclohexene-1-carboxylate synthase